MLYVGVRAVRFREDQALQATPEQRVQQDGYHGTGSAIDTREPQVILQATQEQREQQDGRTNGLGPD